MKSAEEDFFFQTALNVFFNAEDFSPKDIYRETQKCRLTSEVY